MNRYELGLPGDGDFQPGSNGKVLKNKLGLIDADEVGALEASLLSIAQVRSYHEIDTDAPITVELIRKLHRSWLGALYEFAGKIRTFDLSKDFVRFAPVPHLTETLNGLDSILRENTPCEQMDFERLVVSMTRVHVELVFAHPFREGNGRLARWVAELMALQAGFPAPDWGFELNLDERRQEYFAALRRGFAMDFTPLEALVAEALRRGVRLAEDPTDGQ